VYEANAEPGGILRYGIPEYRLPKRVLAREIGFIKKMGVKFIFNKKIDEEGIRRITQGYDATLIATGAYRNMPLGIPGENLEGVMAGTAFLEAVATGRMPGLGKRVLIIGVRQCCHRCCAHSIALGAKVILFTAGIGMICLQIRTRL